MQADQAVKRSVARTGGQNENEKMIEIAGMDPVKSSEALLRNNEVEVPEDSRQQPEVHNDCSGSVAGYAFAAIRAATQL